MIRGIHSCVGTDNAKTRQIYPSLNFLFASDEASFHRLVKTVFEHPVNCEHMNE